MLQESLGRKDKQQPQQQEQTSPNLGTKLLPTPVHKIAWCGRGRHLSMVPLKIICLINNHTMIACHKRGHLVRRLGPWPARKALCMAFFACPIPPDSFAKCINVNCVVRGLANCLFSHMHHTKASYICCKLQREHWTDVTFSLLRLYASY